jgi:hypothetical protein
MFKKKVDNVINLHNEKLEEISLKELSNVLLKEGDETEEILKKFGIDIPVWEIGGFDK